MSRDLCLGVDVVGVPTVREADGLALSSRNRYLGPEERRRATGLSRALRAARIAEPPARPGHGRAAAASSRPSTSSPTTSRSRTPDLAAVDPSTAVRSRLGSWWPPGSGAPG